MDPQELNAAESDEVMLSEDIVFSQLAQEGNIDWLLCRHATTGETFVLVTAASEEAVFHVTQLLKNEYALRARLAESWSLKPQRHTLFKGRYALIYRTFNYRTLADMLCMPPGGIPDFLGSAAMLCHTLGRMHQQGLVHGDIKPANFFYNDDGTVYLGGFGLSFIDNDLLQHPRLPVAGGTLAYMSPEHTSRAAHPVSRVSDLYSLGIVLYELLTGRLPYGSAEGRHAEWVHHHIASEALPPHLIRPDVPLILSSIILRLLAKSPEYRYQTAEGVLADLGRCAATLMPDGMIESFTLGLQDAQSADYSPDSLYTDHPQATDILAAFDEVSSSGKHSLVAISGGPGAGKSSLIGSALKLLRHKKALLTVVKADQHSPVLPYAVFTAAFRTLALHVLGLPTQEMTRWKTHITRLLGEYAGLAVNLVPELGILLNQQAAVQMHLHPLDAKDRFNLVACSLVKAFTASGRPLVMLIDDVHWADRATLLLLQNLLSLSEDIPLLLVITCRDSVSLPCPTIAGNLNRIRACAVRITDIMPEPLSEKNIADWLAGLFHTRSPATAELARVIHEKTAGNPLATREFFRQAVRDGLITHHAPLRWSCDPQALRSCHYTANVAASVLQHLASLPLSTRRLLGRLASLGSAGVLDVFSRIITIPVSEIERTLLPAVTARLITLNEAGYAFMHDTMHEAALNLLNDEDKDSFHCAAALYYIHESSLDVTNALLFRAAHHLLAVKTLSLLTPDAARFCQLLLKASRRAKTIGDYISALRYLQTARLLNQGAGEAESGEFLLEEAECEFLNGNLPAALELSAAIHASPGEVADKAEAACLIAEIHMRQSDSKLALETALAWLAVFGIQLNRNPAQEECDEARIVLKEDVGKNPYTRFRSLPLVSCKNTEAVMDLLASASTFAAFINPRLHFMILCRLLHLSMAHGLSGASTLALSWYGVVCGDRYGEYSRGFASTLLARELVCKHDFVSFKARTLLPLDQVSVWTMPLTYAIERAKAAFDVGVETGDRTSACLALRHLIMNYLARGDHLDGVHTSITRGLLFVRKAQYKDVEVILGMQLDYVLFLRKPRDGLFTGHHFVTPVLAVVKPENAVEPMYLMQFWLRLYKAMAHFFANEYADAERWFKEAAPFTALIPGHVHMLDFHLYSALSVTIPLSAGAMTDALRLQLKKHLDRIVTWSNENVKTFSDKEALLRAELLRLEGETARASEQFERAITLSHEGQFHHINGLACELAARMAYAREMAFAGDAYIKGAMAAWERWGADAKVRQLETQSPALASHASRTALSTVSFEQSAVISDLQSMVTVMRALTEEINLDRLIHILMMMLVERAGAQHCMLIRLIDGNVPEIQARASTTAEGVKVKIVRELPVATDLPLSVLSAVIRTGQEIRTGKPEVFSPFSQDNYLVASGAAVMCVPMFRQAQMVGVLYLENRLMPDVFTADHSRIVAMLGAQAAVSLETARLYAELVDENIQRRKIEKQLRASQTSLMLGEKISHTGTWHWHLEPDIQYISDEYKRIMGLPAGQIATSMAEFQRRVHPDDIACLRELIETSVREGVTMQAEFRIVRDDGECRYIKGIGEPNENWPEVAEYFGTLTDITAQRQSEDAVRSAQAELARVARATTVGQLTSSIAHEINQPLMSIVANAGASQRWLKRHPANLENASKSLDEIIREGRRAGDIIHGLQALTRNQVAKFAPAKMHRLTRDIIVLSRLELERRFVSLELDLTARNDEVFCESVQIQQVLLNLVINAIEAMANNAGARTLRIASSHPASDLIRIEIADNGIGLSEEVTGKIFDSFYTTKAEGMGMGLTISKEIIKRHGGELRAENRLDGGCLFWFTLPVEGGSKP
ncbi:AAA family ATPase [Erwinia sp. 198]|uniref:trifunctional serine/threonine-protein kinase/ATP-binding protein/sensor histidine kinase n=1 Tax=Erwinia sp. 198 TaxID=2022746 RepID=UPI000F66EF34|nr:GAF domain-containing protein [Erwinia sp. 198]